MSQPAHRTSRTRGWSVVFVVAFVVGLAAESNPRTGFWGSYVFDIAGPIWAYILVRGLHSSNPTFLLRRHFTPEGAVAFVIGFCFLLELGQYFGLYHGRFDPYDLVAFVAGALPCYIADKYLCGPNPDLRQV